MVKKLATALVAAVSLVMLPAGATAAQQAPVTLDGEILYYADNTRLSTGTQCSTDAAGNSTYTFDVDDGFAIGPYPGTFDETVTVTIGPRTLGSIPFPPFDLPEPFPDPPIPGASDAASFFTQGSLVTVQAAFQIDSAVGRVDGTKTLSGVVPAPGSGACTDFSGATAAQVSGFYKDVRAYDLEYEARIHTADGTFVDEGGAVLTAREGIAQDPNGNLFFRFEDLLETFASALDAPVELRPGLGCGDLNHAHERAGECKKQA